MCKHVPQTNQENSALPFNGVESVLLVANMMMEASQDSTKCFDRSPTRSQHLSTMHSLRISMIDMKKDRFRHAPKKYCMLPFIPPNPTPLALLALLPLRSLPARLSQKGIRLLDTAWQFPKPVGGPDSILFVRHR